MTSRTEDAALTLTSLMTRALAAENDKSCADADCPRLLDATVGGLCILVSGQGVQRKSEIEALGDRLTTLFGSAVKVATDVWEDYEGGLYTCMWLNLDAAVAYLEA